MKERPILYSAPMVCATLDDTKTQTRRIAKLTEGGHVKEPRGHRRWHPADPEAVQACPYGQPGDRLWVRETWGFNPDFPRQLAQACFRADPGHEHDGIKWVPSIHMPRRASRITLEITSCRLERLQAISEADCIAEGIEKTQHGFWRTYGQGSCDGTYSPRASFRCLWASINGAESWEANPWVWAIGFKRLAT